MDAIKTIDLTKKYKDTIAVDKLNITVKAGELFSLLGVNGAGKSSLTGVLRAEMTNLGKVIDVDKIFCNIGYQESLS